MCANLDTFAVVTEAPYIPFREEDVCANLDTFAVVTEAPYIPFREEDVCANLDTFAVVFEDDVRKLVMKSKATSCDLDPMPTKLVKEYMEELLPLFTTSSISLLLLGNSALVMLLLKKAGLVPILKNYRPVSNLQYVSKLTERAV